MPYREFVITARQSRPSVVGAALSLFLVGCMAQKNTIADFEGAYPSSLNYNFISVTPDVVFNNPTYETDCYTRQNRDKVNNYIYRLGIGDRLFIKLAVINSSETYRETAGTDLTFILPQPHLSQDESSFAIDGMGNINVPYAGSIHAEGKTVSELQTELVKRFKKYVRNPFTDVKIHEYKSKFVEVQGQITHPQRLSIDDSPMTVTRALQLAGGISEDADLKTAFVEDQNGSRKYVNLFELLNRGRIEYNILMESGDTLVVPYTDGNEVYVTGEVIDRKIVKTHSRPMSLTKAIMEANGPHFFAGDPSRVFVFRNMDAIKKPCSTRARIETKSAGHNKKAQIDVFHFDMKQPENYLVANSFSLLDNDIVYVATRRITDWQRFITQVLPANISFWADPRVYD